MSTRAHSESAARIITSHSGILWTIVSHYTDFAMFFKYFSNPFKSKRVYLDYASSTPLDRKMLSQFPKIPRWYSGANPSALHQEGVTLKQCLADVRGMVAKSIGAQTNEIIFTSNATESDNLAVLGPINYFLQEGISPKEIGVYTSPFEHSAVSETVRSLSRDIFVCTLLQEGGYLSTKKIVLPEGLKVMIVSVMMVQNEIGTVQPIKDLAKQIRKLRKEHPTVEILFHTDATQAPLYYDLHVARLGIDMMTLGATKLYCSKGVGMLYKKRTVGMTPIMHGGGQEYGLRPGTEPVLLIHQFAHALVYAQEHYESQSQKILQLRIYFETKLKEKLPQVRITGGAERTPHISHVVIPNIESELLVIELDARGVAVSSKSACKTEDASESELLSLLYPHETLGAIRFSYGRMTTKKDLDKAIKALRSVVKKYSTAL